jgi:hypothetical protein
MQVIVMPAGSKSALIHYRNTIETRVPIDKIRMFAGDEIASELQRDGGDSISVWGFTAGGKNRNVVRWNKIESGCVALFGGERKVKSYGTVVRKAQLPGLAAALWGRDTAESTWEYLIFIKGVQPLEGVSYEMLNEAAGYADKYFIRAFEVWDPDRSARVIRALQQWLKDDTGSNSILLEVLRSEADSSGVFDPKSDEDAKERTLASIIRRQGQPKFRNALVLAYNGKCAISGCNAIEALEAAHIIPYSGKGTNDLSNGLLLRADLHTLLDLGLLAIDPESMRVLLSPRLAHTAYIEFHAKELSLPSKVGDQPSKTLLQQLLEVADV